VLDAAVDQIVRLGGIKVEKNLKVDGGDPIAKLTKQGFKAFFVATGTPYPRPLTLGIKPVEWQGLKNVEYGLTFLDQAGKGELPPDYYKGKRVIVIGGGNVAFDAARTARRLGGDITMVCLETGDKNHKDGIPADAEEIEGAEQEGIRIVYSRGVGKIAGVKGKFTKIDCPKCTSVFDEKGFNPQFDAADRMDIEGDVLLITIGQMWDKSLLQAAGLFDEKGRLAIDPLTHQSLKQKDVFIGGDVRKVGFMVDAMAEGRQAAYAIDQHIKGATVQRWALRYEGSEAPLRAVYKTEPPAKWTSPDSRMNFDMFEVGLTIDEAVQEARRCLECGPCISCKACVATGIQPVLPTVKVDEQICSGCGICVSACNYHTCHMVDMDVVFEGKVIGQDRVSFTDSLLCKACGQCVSACPAGARSISPDFSSMAREKIDDQPGIVCFACKFGWGYTADDDKFASIKEIVPVICIGKVKGTDILEAFTKKGANGVLLLGCAQGDCHFMDGNLDSQKRIFMLHRVMESFGIRKERLEVVTSVDPRGDKMPVLINSLRDRLNRLGPLDWKKHIAANNNK
jgi:NADPH-dependent glutamate synthase beta subunit-like oxidoreductase/coenzyme F420-reducing hydrogenase delta subunit